MHHGERFTQVLDPGPLRDVGGLKMAMYVLMALGLSAFAFQAANDQKMAMTILTIQFCYFFFISLGALFFVAVHHAASAWWPLPFRRAAEGLTAFVPAGIGILAVLMVGSGVLYSWAQAGADYPYEGSVKDWYLSQPFFIVRCLAFAGLMWLFQRWLVGGSLEQDRTKDPKLSKRFHRTSIIFLIVFAYSFTLFTFDLLMSLEPRFFSTMYGIYAFSGSLLSGLATLTLVVLAMRRSGYLSDAVRLFHMRDLGTWLMAFATFMMYIGFSQYMLIWYANLPDETFYYIRRSEPGWWEMFLALPILKWIIPFFLLMPNTTRTHPVALIAVSVAILIGQWLDLYWLVMPAVTEGFRMPGVIDALVFLGVGGVFGFTVLSFFASHSVLAVGDPNMLGSINGDHLK